MSEQTKATNGNIIDAKKRIAKLVPDVSALANLTIGVTACHERDRVHAETYSWYVVQFTAPVPMNYLRDKSPAFTAMTNERIVTNVTINAFVRYRDNKVTPENLVIYYGRYDAEKQILVRELTPLQDDTLRAILSGQDRKLAAHRAIMQQNPRMIGKKQAEKKQREMRKSPDDNQESKPAPTPEIPPAETPALDEVKPANKPKNGKK